jgi:hypothetical protein
MRPPRRRAVRQLSAGFGLAALLVALLPALPPVAQGPVIVHAQDVETAVDQQKLIPLPLEASHVVLSWTGAAGAQMTVAFGQSPNELGEEVPIELDGEIAADGEEIDSPVLWTGGARFARVTTDRPIAKLKITAIDSTDRRPGLHIAPPVARAAVGQPAIISRAGWGANESYRFDSGGHELFPPGYFLLQKVIVHHTAGRNNDPNPEATIRAIYYMQAIGRHWGDIDYNFLIDWQGRIYEGRHSRDYGGGPITGEDLAGNVVRGAHARDYNDGTVGIALLGNFTSVQPAAAQRTSLEKLLAWKLERHGLNPLGASTYTNPQLGNSKYLNNISGHRNVNQTACPGNAFYATFPALRQAVANRIAATSGSSNDHTAPSLKSLARMVVSPTGATTMPFGLIFSEPVTGLTAGDLTVGGTSPGWTIKSITGKAATYQVNVVAPPGGPPDEGTVTLSLADSSVTDLGGNVGPGAATTATVTYAHDAVAPSVVIYQTPHRSATNAAFVDWTATFNEPVMGFDVADVVIGGPAAGAWSLRRIFGQDALYAFTTEQASPSNGTFSIQIAAGSITDLAGNPVGASNLITVTVDRSAPNANGPSVSLGAGTTLSGGALRAGVKLSGTDVGPAGIASYDVARSYDGHAFQLIAAFLTGASYGTTLTSGHSYRFEVRARDKAGNVGPWKAGPTVRPALTQQTSSAVHFSGSSATSSAASYSGGSERHLLAAGASASYTTTARSLSFITTKSSSRGSARIYIDGVFQTTVNLNASSTTYRFVAFTKTWGAVGTHTIKVVSVGTPVARVDIDAFGVIR